MAITSKILIGPIPPEEKFVIVKLTLDNNYPAGGYALTPALFGLVAFAAMRTGVSGLIFPSVLSGYGAGGFALEFDVDLITGNLRAYYPTGGATASPAALTDPVGGVPGVGTLAVTTTPAAGATAMTSTAAQPAMAGVISGALAGPALTPGRGKEVAAATDLSTFSVVMLAVGH